MPGQLAGYERIAQIGVCRVLEEPRTEFDKGGLDAEAELFLCRRTVNPSAFAPALERAIGRRCVHGAEPAGMDHQPKRGEIGEEPLVEDFLKVGLDPGGAGEAEIVAHEPERAAVRGDTPKSVFVRVEIFLQELGGRPAAGLVSEQGDGLIDTGLPALGRGKRRDDNGHPAVVGGVPNREASLGQDDRSGFRYVGKTEAVREQIQDKPLGGTDVAVLNGTEPFPVSQGDLVVPGDFVAQFEAGKNPVAFIRLLRHVEGRGTCHDFRRQEGAGDFDRREVQAGGPA